MDKVKPRRAPDTAREGGVYIDGVNVTKKAKEEKKEKKPKKEVKNNAATS